MCVALNAEGEFPASKIQKIEISRFLKKKSCKGPRWWVSKNQFFQKLNLQIDRSCPKPAWKNTQNSGKIIFGHQKNEKLPFWHPSF